MQLKRILITRIFPEVGQAMLKEAGFAVTSWNQETPMTQEQLIAQAQQHDALYCTITEKIDAHFLDQCPHLEVISQFAVGYDNIDIAEASKRGIPVGYTPDVLSDATADVAFGLLIATARKFIHLHKTIRKGEWSVFRPAANLGQDIKGKTLGVFGMGRIGLEMARRCKGAYQMPVIYHNRNRNMQAEQELGARYVDFDTLLKESDFLSVHCALTPETKEIFNAKAFAKMKPTSIFINTSRGAVHNEQDLADALRSGQIWGAGLDVTNPEPMQKDNPLQDVENVTILPHIGSGARETRDNMARLAAQNIIDFYRNRTMPAVVNKEVL